jgi:hypothetical protein
MGTNYYLHSDTCDHCGRGDEPLHIGKSRRLFHAPIVGWSDDGEPVRYPTSWADWKVEILKAEAAGGGVFDEYGEELDALAFIADVEAVDPLARAAWFEGEKDRRGGIVPPDEWLDDEGFHFSARGFS